MMNKEIYLKNVAENLALLSRQVEIINAVNLYDVNIIAEDFYSELLNIIYGYSLKNANIVEKNAQAIDLIDSVNRISIQVTSDNSSTKIKHTISEFINSKLYEKYDILKILVLTRKKKYTVKLETEGKFDFDIKNDIIEVNDLIKDIRGLETHKIKQISEFIEKELCEKVYEVKETQANEVDTIIDLIEYISSHKKVKKKTEVKIDPEYKLFKRFQEFAEQLVNEYTTLYMIYGSALDAVEEILGTDEAQDIIIMYYLQDISIQYLDETYNDPIRALNLLVTYFEKKLSLNGKKYDRAAIKFYLVNEMIKCRVFPNERSEYNGSI